MVVWPETKNKAPAARDAALEGWAAPSKNCSSWRLPFRL
jgi:hypothetical protein